MIRLIVGLSNPGIEYASTRHNAGAWYVESLAKYFASTLVRREASFFGYTSKILTGGRNIHLLIPTTFMNFSGKAVNNIAHFYRIKTHEILIAHDELYLSPGIARFKSGGGHGGHNGLKDIINKLNGDSSFYRLRIGIAQSKSSHERIADFVLGKPQSSERELINKSIDKSVRCTDIWFKEGVNKATNHLHSSKER